MDCCYSVHHGRMMNRTIKIQLMDDGRSGMPDDFGLAEKVCCFREWAQYPTHFQIEDLVQMECEH